MQILCDYMTQSINLGPHGPSIRMLPAEKLSSAAVKAQMVKFGLDGKQGKVKSISDERTNCDICQIKDFSSKDIAVYMMECKKVPGTDVCTNRQRWDLPCCSWSDIPSAKIKSADSRWSAQSMARRMEVEAIIWALHRSGSGSKTFEHDLVARQIEEQGEDEEDGIEVTDGSNND